MKNLKNSPPLTSNDMAESREKLLVKHVERFDTKVLSNGYLRADRRNVASKKMFLTLDYWCEYWTQFHIAQSWSSAESCVSRIIVRIEYVLTSVKEFGLPRPSLQGFAA